MTGGASVTIEFSTLLIAVFTIALAAFSLMQTIITRNAARRQTRAYMGIKNASVQIQNGGQIWAAIIQVELLNTGQSPAYRFTTWLKARLDDPNAVPYGEVSSIKERSGTSICVPGVSVNTTVHLQISQQDLQDLRAGRKALFVWGGCDYEDAFKKKRYFKHRSCAAANNGIVWAVQPHKIGYDAN